MSEFALAGPADAVPIARELRRFYNLYPKDAYRIPYDHASTLEMVLDVIDRGIAIFNKAGCAGVLFTRFPFNQRYSIAQVMFWSFTQPSGAKALDRIIEMVGQMGVDLVAAASHAPRAHYRTALRQIGVLPC